MAFSTSSSNGPSAVPNVPPLIDVLLVLLIIFMVITPIGSKGLDSVVPESSNRRSPAPDEAALKLRLSASSAHAGEILFQVEDRSVTEEQLGRALSRQHALHPNATLWVDADRSLRYGPVAEAMSRAHEAGFRSIAFLPSR